MDNAKLVFEHTPFKNAVTWTSMVTAYVQNQQPRDAVRLVRKMKRMGIECNCITYSSLLSSLSCEDHLLHTLQIHCCVIRVGMDSNPYISSSLVTAYSKCGGTLDDFNKVRFSASTDDAVQCNAILNAYCNMGLTANAYSFFYEMRENGIHIDVYTILSLSRVVTDSSTLLRGNEIHAIVIKAGFASNLSVQNGLVSMYARCGAISESKSIFFDMNGRDVVSWNALLTGCAHNGLGSEAVEYFEMMKESDVRPNNTTFLVVLAACSHCGLIEKGIECVEYMKRDGFMGCLEEEHHSAIVDIFARGGYLKEAEAFAEEMKVGATAYRALLSACLVHGNLEMAANVANKLLQICPMDSATYVLVSRALTRQRYSDGAAHAMDFVCNKHATKCPAISWL